MSFIFTQNVVQKALWSRTFYEKKSSHMGAFFRFSRVLRKFLFFKVIGDDICLIIFFYKFSRFFYKNYFNNCLLYFIWPRVKSLWPDDYGHKKKFPYGSFFSLWKRAVENTDFLGIGFLLWYELIHKSNIIYFSYIGSLLIIVLFALHYTGTWMTYICVLSCIYL